MCEGIQYEITYETPNGTETINTVRHFEQEDGMTVICYYPHAEQWTPSSELVRMEEKRRHIPTKRVVQIDEVP